MEKELKMKMNFSLSAGNARWLRQISEKSGIAMSLFLDAVLTGMRASQKEDVTEREAMFMAFDQIAKGIRKRD